MEREIPSNQIFPEGLLELLAYVMVSERQDMELKYPKYAENNV